MAGKDEKNQDQNPPLDDLGIYNDHIIELCAYVIKTLHDDYIDKDESPKHSIKDLRDLTLTLQMAWELSREIIDFDTRLKLEEKYGPLPPDFFTDSNGPSLDMDDIDEEDFLDGTDDEPDEDI